MSDDPQPADPGEQIIAELFTLAQQAHWMPASVLAFVSELGYGRNPDTMRFPHTPEGLQAALAWARREAAIIQLADRRQS